MREGRAMQDAQTIHAQTAALVARSRWVAAQARQSLQEHYWLRSHRLVWIRGGADRSSGGASATTTEVLRQRLATGQLPLIPSGDCWAGPATERHACAVCDVGIGVG